MSLRSGLEMALSAFGVLWYEPMLSQVSLQPGQRDVCVLSPELEKPAMKRVSHVFFDQERDYTVRNCHSLKNTPNLSQ